MKGGWVNGWWLRKEARGKGERGYNRVVDHLSRQAGQLIFERLDRPAEVGRLVALPCEKFLSSSALVHCPRRSLAHVLVR